MKRGRIFRGKVENREVCGGKGAARGTLWLITKKTTDFVRKGESIGTLKVGTESRSRRQAPVNPVTDRYGNTLSTAADPHATSHHPIHKCEAGAEELNHPHPRYPTPKAPSTRLDSSHPTSLLELTG